MATLSANNLGNIFKGIKRGISSGVGKDLRTLNGVKALASKSMLYGAGGAVLGAGTGYATSDSDSKVSGAITGGILGGIVGMGGKMGWEARGNLTSAARRGYAGGMSGFRGDMSAARNMRRQAVSGIRGAGDIPMGPRASAGERMEEGISFGESRPVRVNPEYPNMRASRSGASWATAEQGDMADAAIHQASMFPQFHNSVPSAVPQVAMGGSPYNRMQRSISNRSMFPNLKF